MTSQFTWIPIYQELADKLANWKDRQQDLIAFLEGLREKGYTITPFTDKGEEGEVFLLDEIDPFTFYAVFNRGITLDKRVSILVEIKKFLNLKSEIPSDFDGIPIMNAQQSWFIAYKKNRDIDDVNRLWRVFELALTDNPLENQDFIDAFNKALTVKYTNINLTMGLFWIRPYTFISLDQRNRQLFNKQLPSSGLSAKYYIDFINSIDKEEKSYPEYSLEAWRLTSKEDNQPNPDPPIHEDVNYWLVGAYWRSQETPDQTERFINEGIWMNGYEDKYTDEVNSMKVGDKIAIKSSFIQKRDLPFDNRNKTISCMRIKAIGTIVANRGNGQLIEVEWEPDFKEKDWYFYTSRLTVWKLNTDKKFENSNWVNNLINFVWYDKDQNYDMFIEAWWGQEERPFDEPYSIDDILASGVFLHSEDIEFFLKKLEEKKAVIIQGPPGTGKTFIARKLAFALMQEKDLDRLEFIQFHQSYSYDDFIRGYRPAQNDRGSFIIQNGIFYEFCQKAMEDPDRDYVFIIDEINRGNLSQIFGEVLMLIERDKRGKDFSVPLVYRNENESRFYVPQNLHLIGLMNLADRSLAMVDYALRRRFGFIDLSPQFNSELYSQWLSERQMEPDLINLIVSKMSDLNRVIREDPVLGENYQIGHSYFCPRGDDFSSLNKEWYQSIIRTEIIPLLKEYWFDNQTKVDDAVKSLLS